MAETTIAYVRTTLGDLGTSPVYSDDYITLVMSEAAEWLADWHIDIASSATGGRLHRLKTAWMLGREYLGRVQQGHAERIKEGDCEIQVGDLRGRVQAWQDEIDQAVFDANQPGFVATGYYV